MRAIKKPIPKNPVKAKALIAAIAGLLVLAGCGPGSGSGSRSAAATAPEHGPVAPAPEHGPVAPSAADAGRERAGLWFEPAELPGCGKPSSVEVHWDAGAFPGVKAVDILGVGKSGKEVLFLSSGRSGSKATGRWMRGGSVMVLRDGDTGAELVRAQIRQGAAGCSKAGGADEAGS